MRVSTNSCSEPKITNSKLAIAKSFPKMPYHKPLAIAYPARITGNSEVT
jgi:hypothetical protein